MLSASATSNAFFPKIVLAQIHLLNPRQHPVKVVLQMLRRPK